MEDDFEDLLMAYELRASLQNADSMHGIVRSVELGEWRDLNSSHSEDSKDIACIIPSLCHETCMCSAVLSIKFGDDHFLSVMHLSLRSRSSCESSQGDEYQRDFAKTADKMFT